MKRLISVFLIIGLVITAMPAFAVTADAASNNNASNTGDAQPEINLDEGMPPGDDSSGSTPREEGNTEQVDIETLDLGNGSNVTYTEKTVKVRPDHIGVHQSEYDFKKSDGLIPMNSLTEIYLIFNTDSEAAADSDGDDEIPYISFNELLGLDNIQSAQLSFSTANNNADLQFDIYPLSVPLKTKADSEFQWTDALKESFIFEATEGLKTRERLSTTQQSDNDEFTFDVTADIRTAQSGELGSLVAGNGVYGYVLTLMNGEENFDCRDKNMPELTVTYLHEEERAPTEADLEAADAMLAQRQMIQVELEGSGTVEDPYLIYDADDLQGMAENDNACYKLMCDIDLEGKNWRPPGYYYWYPFMGYLDGNGHTIKNLHVGGTGDDAWNTNAGGLFGYFEGRVENLHVETVQAKREGVDFFGYAGGIAGVANAPAEIVNCSFNGYVSGNGSIGGLVGAAYPGVIIENCAAIGTVDMSDSFAYMKDDKWENTKAIWDSGMEIVTYGLSFLCISDEYTSKTVLEGENPFRAIVEIVMDKITNFPIDSLMNTEYMQAMRKSNIGGLVGLNYGDIRNSYSSVDIYNLEGYMQDISVFGFTFSAYNNLSKVGSIVGLNIGDYGVINNCFYDKTKPGNGAEDSEVIKGKDTDDLKSPGLFGGEANSVMHGTSASSQWDYSVSRKSTGGLPLPKTNQVNRDLEDKDCVYYNSRVLMKTRPDFIIGTEVVELGEKQYIYNDGWYEINNGVASIEADAQSIDNLENGEGKATGAIYCTRCDELTAEAAQYAQGSEERTALGNQIAVTGRFQRGSDARPYHVHDIDSLLAMQDSKESHFILCSDIDFKISEKIETAGNNSDNSIEPIQKYWWPAGKSHTSPIKGSIKGNVAYDGEIIPITDGISPKSVEEKMQRFAIKNLTVQSNRHVGLFACLRGTFSDINIQLSEGMWEDWKDGIREDKKDVEGKVIAGLSTIGDKSSAGAVAGETVNGASIRNCVVTGTINSDASFGGSSYTHEPGIGVIKGALRSGGIVGMNNRGCIVEGCEALVYIDAENYETVFIEDMFGTGVEIVKAGIAQLGQTTDEILSLTDIIKDGDMSKWKKGAKALLSTASLAASIVDGPIANYVYSRWGNVCVGGLVGENYGTIKNSVAYSESQIKCGEAFSGWALNCHTAVGRSNPHSEEDATVKSKNASQSFYPWLNNMTGKGTKEEPLLVGDEKDLQRLADAEQLNGIYIKQMVDINVEEFKGFTKDFKGNYDGNGCSISGMDSDSPLFKTLDGGVVKNLELRNSTFECSSAIAGDMKNNSVIQNCFIADDVTIGGDSVSYASGFADRIEDSTIYNVINYGKLAASNRICGIAREAVGESFILNSYINTQKTATAPATSDYALVYSADGSVRYKNCYWEGEKEKPQGINFTAEDSCEKFTETYEIFDLMENFENIKPDEANGYPEYVSYDEPMVWGVLETGEKNGFCFLFNTFKLYGAGIKNNPYLIQNEEDFYSFVKNIFLGTDTEGLYFLQTADIEVTAATLDYLKVSEGGVYPIFKGNYDGGKHTISGLTIDNGTAGTAGETKAALFAETEGALIENLGIENSSFEADIAAPFIGEAREGEVEESELDERATIVRNCWVEDDVMISGTTSGGIVGQIEDAVIYNCAIYSTSPYETNNMKDLSSGICMCILRNSDGNYDVIKQAEDIDESCEPETILSQAFLTEINDEISGFGIEGLRSWTLSENGEMLLPIGAVVELDTAEPTTETEAIPSSTSDEPDFAGGSGTETDPYLIKNIAQLSRVKNYLKSGFHFKLVADLDFNDYSGNWVAIGTDADYFAFQGVFDGNGHTIKNLTMNSSASAGLFGYCAGTIKNLKIEGFEIDTTGTTAGALVAELCAGGRIEQCAVINSDVNSAHYSGGIAGAAQKGSVMRNIYADHVNCSLDNILYLNGAEDAGLGGGKDSQWGAGVLSTDLSAIMAGFDIVEPIIQLLNSNSVTNVFGKLKDTIFSIAENGSQYRTAAAGGITGFLGGKLENSWALRIMGQSDVRPGAGWLTPHEGILVGRNFYGTIAGDNYAVELQGDYDSDPQPVGNEPNNNETVTTVTCQPIDTHYFTDEIDSEVNAPLDASRWTSEKKNDKYKYELKIFSEQNPDTKSKLAKLDYEIIARVPEIDEEDGFYMITDVNELAYVEYEGWSDYKLMNDIDLTGYNWVPLCREHDQYFDGTFDGQGYTIYGLNVETNENGGLFGYILGDVKNLNLGVEQVDAYGSAGGLAAGVYYPGKISKVAVLDNDIAIAMMGERILNKADYYDEETPEETIILRFSEKEQESFRNFRELFYGNTAKFASATMKTVEDLKDRLKVFYDGTKYPNGETATPGKNTLLDQNNKEQHYGGITHIIGGGNSDGAGVGGLAGIVGKDVLIENCYSRVNVSNANFVIVKEIDFIGFIMNIVSSAANDLFIPLGNRVMDEINSQSSTAKIAEKINKLIANVAKASKAYNSLAGAYDLAKGEYEVRKKAPVNFDELEKEWELQQKYKEINEKFANDFKDFEQREKDIAEYTKLINENQSHVEEQRKIIDNYRERGKEKNKDYQEEIQYHEEKIAGYQKEIESYYQKIDSAKKKNRELYEKTLTYADVIEKEIYKRYGNDIDVEKRINDFKEKFEKKYDAEYETNLNNIKKYVDETTELAAKRKELSEINLLYGEDNPFMMDEDFSRKYKLESEIADLEKKISSSEEAMLKSVETITMQENHNRLLNLKDEADGISQEDVTIYEEEMKKKGVKSRDEAGNIIEIYIDNDEDEKKVNEMSMRLKNAKKTLEKTEEEKENFDKKYGKNAQNINVDIKTSAWLVTVMNVTRSIGNWGFNIVMEFDDSCVGGLVGESRGRLVNCYTIGQVNSNFFDAGAKSGFWHTADLFDSVYSGRLAGRVRTGADGGEVGRIASTNQLVINCYYYGGYYGGVGEKEVYGEGLGNPCMTALDWKNDKGFDMKSMLTFNGFDFSKTWKMGDYSKYPELVNGSDTEYLNSSTAQTQELLSFESGDGSKENPFIIKEESQFLNMSTFSNMDYYYRLEADLEFTRNGGEVVLDDDGQPIVINGKVLKTAGSSNDSFSDSTDFFGGSGIGRYDDFGGNDNGFTEAIKRFFAYGIIHITEDLNEKMLASADEGEAFAGHFDGNGHSITYKSIKDSEHGYYAGGLFPLVSGSIENLEVICKGVNSKARYNGLLTGKLLGGAVIENVSVTYAPDSTGTETYKLTGRLAAGGLVGYAEDNTIISNCALYDQNSQIPYDDGSGKIGAITGESLGDIEYVYYDTATHCSDKELMPVGNSSDKLHCIYSADTEESMTESYFKGFDFNNVWTMAANAQSKPVLRALNSTPLFDYRRALDEACEKTDTVIEGAGTMADPFLIDSAMDFEAINEVMKDGHTFSGVYFRQNDTFISLRKPFSQGTVFGGNYDGNGHHLFICIDTPRDYALTRPFRHLNGAIFRNCDIRLNVLHDNAVINEGFASSAHNTMFLNCRFLNEGTEDADIIYSASGVSAVNCLFIRCRLYDPELEGKRDGKTVIISAPYQYACFNGDIVGLKDVNQSVEINNYTWDKRYLSDDEEGKDYTYSNTYNALAAMTGVPDNLKPLITPWEQNDGVWTMQQFETIKFDLGSGIQIEKIERLHYTTDNKLESVIPLYESVHARGETGAINIVAPAGSVLKIDFSYGGEDNEDYVLVTQDLAQDMPNLKDALSGTASAGTLPSSTETFTYAVEGDTTISLYKKGIAKKATVITDSECQGADIDRVRLYYTDRIFDEVGTKQAKVTGFKSDVTTRQKLTIEYNGRSYETEIELSPLANWGNATSFAIAELPDRLVYRLDEPVDLSGMKVVLNPGMDDEAIKPIEGLFRLGINEEGTESIIQYVTEQEFESGAEHAIILREEEGEEASERIITMIIDGYDGGSQIMFDIIRTDDSYAVSIEPEENSRTVFTDKELADIENELAFDITLSANDGTEKLSLAQLCDAGGSYTFDKAPLTGKLFELRTLTVQYRYKSMEMDILVVNEEFSVTAEADYAAYVSGTESEETSARVDFATDMLAAAESTDSTDAPAYGYVSFDMTALADLFEANAVKKVSLAFEAASESSAESAVLELREAEEKPWADWGTWNDKPELSDTLGSIRVPATEDNVIEMDVTAYVQEKADEQSVTFGFSASEGAARISGGVARPKLVVELADPASSAEADGVYLAVNAAASFVKNDNSVKTTATGSMINVKNNAGGTNTRHGYLTFDLEQLKEELTAKRLEIASASLSFGAKMDRENVQRTLYLHGVNAEKETWSYWNDKPELTAAIASDLIEGDELQTVSRDVTAYLKESLDGDQVTFGLTASECDGELIQVAAGGEYAPQLVIYTRAAQQ